MHMGRNSRVRKIATYVLKMPVLPIAVWRKSRDGGIIYFLFLFHDIPSDVTQQLIKTKWDTE